MKRFVTEYVGPHGRFGYMVDACDWAHAQAICDERRPGERVLGVLHVVMEVSEPCHERADALCRALADDGDDESPDSEAFRPIDAMGLFEP